MNLGARLGIPYPIPNITSYKTFLSYIKNSEIIHAHGHPYLSSLIAVKLSKKYKKPFILTQHNTFIDYNSIWNNVEKLNDLAVGKQTIRDAKKIITVSKATKNYVLSLGADPEKVEVVYNGVDLDRFKILPGAEKDIRYKLGIPNDAIVAAIVRRIVYKNGIDTLLESAKIAIKNNTKLVYLVIGKGPDFKEIKSKVSQLGIERNFILTGYVSDEDLPLYYNASDFSILPSKSGEGLPLAGLESMACGLPLLATNVGGIGEIMIKGCGQLIPPNDPMAMATAALDLANNEPAKCKKILSQYMKERYSWEKNVETLTSIYEEII
jgi:glycosyltransferase involved in cell wall biosynthesis